MSSPFRRLSLPPFDDFIQRNLREAIDRPHALGRRTCFPFPAARRNALSFAAQEVHSFRREACPVPDLAFPNYENIPFRAAAPGVRRLERCSSPVSAASNPGSTRAAGRSCNRGADAGNGRARRLPSSTLEMPNPDFRAEPACASGTGNPSSAAASARSFRASCTWTRDMFSLLRFGEMVSAIALSL